MYKLKEMILMLCFILSGALCYANGEARIEKEQGEGIPIEIIESGSCTGPSRGNSIIPTLNGHVALANGVYTCTLICGKYQCTNKLVITK